MAQHTKEFFDLIRAIGETRTKHEEDMIIRQEVSTLRNKMNGKNLSSALLRDYIIRMLYCEMLGHECDGYFHAVKMAPSTNLLEKRTGYLAVTLCIHNKHEYIYGIINTIQQDLQNSNYLIVCCALDTITKIINEEIIPAVYQYVINLLEHPNQLVQKKAVMALHAFYKCSPQSCSHINSHVRKALCSDKVCVMSAAIDLLTLLVKENPNKQKDLVPSLISILKQITEHKLHDEDYHGIPAPWIQMKILRICAILGKDDAKASEHMYEVIRESMRQAAAVPKIGQAVVYECCKTIAEIYPNPHLIDQAVQNFSKFLTSSSNNLRYLGLKLLSMFVKVNEKYARQHSMNIIACLEDNDETLQIQTLDLLYKMTNSDNVAVVIEKLQKFMIKSVDEFLKRELAKKISDLAESYAPDRPWYMKIINGLYLDYAKYMDPRTLHSVITEVIADTGDDEQADAEFKRSCVDNYYDLVAERLVIAEDLVKIAAWTFGECGHLSEKYSKEDLLNALCDLLERQYEDSETRYWIVSAMMKLIAHMNEVPPNVGELIMKFQNSRSVELQQRCFECLYLMKNCQLSLPSILPQNGSFSEIEFDEDLSFLDDFVESARKRGARSYLSEEEKQRLFAATHDASKKVDIRLKHATLIENKRKPDEEEDEIKPLKKISERIGLSTRGPWGDDEEEGGAYSDLQKDEEIYEKPVTKSANQGKPKWQMEDAEEDDEKIHQSDIFESTVIIKPGGEEEKKISKENLEFADAIFGGKKKKPAKKTKRGTKKKTKSEQRDADTASRSSKGSIDLIEPEAILEQPIKPSPKASPKREEPPEPQPKKSPKLSPQKEEPKKEEKAKLTLDDLFGGLDLNEPQEPMAPQVQAPMLIPQQPSLLDTLEPIQPTPFMNVSSNPLDDILTPSHPTLSLNPSKTRVSPLRLLDVPRSSETPQPLALDENLEVTYYRALKPDCTTLVLFLAPTRGFTLKNVAITIQPPTKCNVELQGDPKPIITFQRATFTKIEPGTEAILNCDIKPTDMSFGASCLGQISYVDHNGKSKFFPFRTEIDQSDMLRPKQMDTTEYSTLWRKFPQEKRMMISTTYALNNEEFVKRLKRMNIAPISTKGSETIAACEIVGTNIICLVHGKITAQNNGVTLTVRSTSMDLSDRICRGAKSFI